ncbi:MAG: hypothetical protein HZB30_00915 [Nitrospirae bacterium]|nr:hypothetical protein [Nitrospirota bacterium]
MNQKKSHAISMKQVKNLKGITNLAEAIILQSLEDIWTPEYNKETREFFSGAGFKICSEIAGLDTMKQFKVLHFIGGKSNGRNFRVH